MQKVGSLFVELSLNPSAFNRSLMQVKQEAIAFQKELEKILNVNYQTRPQQHNRPSPSKSSPPNTKIPPVVGGNYKAELDKIETDFEQSRQRILANTNNLSTNLIQAQLNNLKSVRAQLLADLNSANARLNAKFSADATNYRNQANKYESRENNIVSRQNQNNRINSTLEFARSHNYTEPQINQLQRQLSQQQRMGYDGNAAYKQAIAGGYSPQQVVGIGSQVAKALRSGDDPGQAIQNALNRKYDFSGLTNAAKSVFYGLGNLALAGFAGVASAITSSLIGALQSAFSTVQGFVGDSITKYADKSSTQKVLTKVEGEDTAGQSMAYITEQSNKLGINLQSARDAYSQFAAAVKGSSLEKFKKDIFEAANATSNFFNMSDANYQGIGLAFRQIMSGASVNAEDLNQLAERIPGFYRLAAESIGVTTSEFKKLISTGKVASEDFLPRIAEKLQAEFGTAVETTRTAQTRLQNAMTAIQESLGQAIEPAVTAGLEFAAQTINEIGSSTGLFDELNAAALQFQSYLQSNPELVQTMGSAIAEIAQGGMQYLAQGAQQLLQHLQENPQAIAQAVEGFTQMLGAVGQIVSAVASLIKMLAEAGAKLGEISSAVANSPVGQAVGGAVQGATGAVGDGVNYLGAIGQTIGTAWSAIQNGGKVPMDGTPTYGQIIEPVDRNRYRVTSGYGPRRAPVPGASTFHKGIDYGTPSGTDVKAPVSGRVTHAGSLGKAGIVVKIEGVDSRGRKTEDKLLHLSKPTVKVGEFVKQGQVVAKSGNTGIGSGAHLDWRRTVNGQYENPEVSLRESRNAPRIQPNFRQQQPRNVGFSVMPGTGQQPANTPKGAKLGAKIVRGANEGIFRQAGYSDVMIDTIKGAEGFEATPYWDYKQWTSGFGTKARNRNERVTPEEGNVRLMEEIKQKRAAISRLVKRPLTNNQMDALTSFVFNVGEGAFGGSTMLKKINAGDMRGAAEEFGKWNKAGGKSLPGLSRRRAVERSLFLHNDHSARFNQPATSTTSASIRPTGSKLSGSTPDSLKGELARIRETKSTDTTAQKAIDYASKQADAKVKQQRTEQERSRKSKYDKSISDVNLSIAKANPETKSVLENRKREIEIRRKYEEDEIKAQQQLEDLQRARDVKAKKQKAGVKLEPGENIDYSSAIKKQKDYLNSIRQLRKQELETIAIASSSDSERDIKKLVSADKTREIISGIENQVHEAKTKLATTDNESTKIELRATLSKLEIDKSFQSQYLNLKDQLEEKQSVKAEMLAGGLGEDSAEVRKVTQEITNLENKTKDLVRSRQQDIELSDKQFTKEQADRIREQSEAYRDLIANYNQQIAEERQKLTPEANSIDSLKSSAMDNYTASVAKTTSELDAMERTGKYTAEQMAVIRQKVQELDGLKLANLNKEFDKLTKDRQYEFDQTISGYKSQTLDLKSSIAANSGGNTSDIEIQKSRLSSNLEKQTRWRQFDEMTESGKYTKGQLDEIKNTLIEIDNLSLENIQSQVQKVTDDRAKATSDKLHESRIGVMQSRGGYLRTMGFEDKAREYDKQIAMEQETYSYNQQIAELERLAKSGTIAAESVGQLRSQLDETHNFKMADISAQFDPLVEVFGQLRGATQNFIKDLIEKPEDALANLGSTITSFLTDMASKFITNGLMNWIFGGGMGGGMGNMFAPQQQSGGLFGSLLGGMGGGMGGGILGLVGGIFGFHRGGVIPTYASGGLIGAIDSAYAKERSHGGSPRLVVASVGERILSVNQNRKFEQLGLDKLVNYAEGGVVGMPAKGSASGKFGDTVNVNVPVDARGGDGKIDAGKLKKVIEAEITEQIIRNKRHRGLLAT